MQDKIKDLSENVQNVLLDFTEHTKHVCGANLLSIVLYGSAAEGRLRPSSDVNLMLVLKAFDVEQINQLREKLRIAYAAIHLQVMFILDTEIAIAADAFALKFTDIFSRHRILSGDDPFINLKVARSAIIHRLKQVIVNLSLRLRERYALVSLREEQLVPIIADVAGPIRASAATILSLQGTNGVHPKEALEMLCKELAQDNWSDILKNFSIAREEQELKHGEAEKTVLGILRLLKAMYEQVQGIE